MIHEEKKVGKIVEELTMFFFSVGANSISSHVKREGKMVIINFASNYDPAQRERLAYLDKYLNEPKNEGMEDIYWELAGSGDPNETSQLLLLGMMLDKAEVTIEEDKAYLKLYKEMMV